MRPHMAHIQNTLIKKQLSEEAGNHKTSYRKYKRLVDSAISQGYDEGQIILELEVEKQRIKNDVKESDDPFFIQGVKAAQRSCEMAINLIINELKSKGEDGYDQLRKQ